MSKDKASRFDQLLKAAQQPPIPPIDAQTSENLDAQTSKHLDVQISKAKSSSHDYKRTTVYLTQDLHRRLKRASLDHGLEMSDIAEAAIAQWIDERSSNSDV